jgi:glycosyltransferase involved in cell wall biosynthesis
VLAVTGRGYSGARQTLLTRMIVGTMAHRLRRALTQDNTVLLVENDADRQWIEGAAPLPIEQVRTMPGAGVNPDVFTSAPEPLSPPIVIGLAARLIRSKGIDLAVAALSRLRGDGLEVELHIAGAPDEMNPDSVDDATLHAWRTTPGVRLLGKVTDVPAFWAASHVACLPSRGGEGLPRSLLEAASCGRAIVTSDTPGCRDFVREEETGFVVRREDVEALARKLDFLCRNGEARARMGKAGRELVLSHYTERHAAEVAAQAWAQVRPRTGK